MNDWIPTTEEIRRDYDPGYPDDSAGFDRWLAAHDAEAYQRGRDDAAFAVATIRNGILTDDGLMIYAWQAIKRARGES